jgi:hypothetical protein
LPAWVGKLDVRKEMPESWISGAQQTLKPWNKKTTGIFIPMASNQ